MLKDKRYFLFDIDGTLAVDETLYDGTKELLDYIEEIGGKSFYITNNSVKSRKDYIKICPLGDPGGGIPVYDSILCNL